MQFFSFFLKTQQKNIKILAKLCWINIVVWLIAVFLALTFVLYLLDYWTVLNNKLIVFLMVWVIFGIIEIGFNGLVAHRALNLTFNDTHNLKEAAAWFIAGCLVSVCGAIGSVLALIKIHKWLKLKNQ